MGETPNRPVRNTHYSQPATEERQLNGAIRHIKHWKPCLGPWCVISGQIILSWYVHYVWYSQPATEEHLINHMIQPRCLSYGGDSQSASEEHPLLPTGHWETAAFDCNMGRVKHTKHWKPSLGPRCVIFDHIIQSRGLSYEGDSQPACEEHPVTPSSTCMRR